VAEKLSAMAWGVSMWWCELFPVESRLSRSEGPPYFVAAKPQVRLSYRETLMRIEFTAGQTKCVFTRSHLWGSAKLCTDDRVWPLQSALNPHTAIGWKLLRTWEVPVDGHTVRIEKRRPLLFPAWRPHMYTVFVDGAVVDSRSGY
jgi:hypothetical protein